MARANLVWQDDDGRFRVFELPESGSSIIGRSPDAALTLHNPTVSRQHALLRAAGGAFIVEHLSRTNPTKVNGTEIARPTTLSDRDRLQVGSIELTFHDLSAADELSGPICSFCSRENKRTDKDCWYCGTSLVNAATVLTKKRVTSCRIVPAIGTAFDLHQGEYLVFDASGARKFTQDAARPADYAAIIQLSEGRPALTPGKDPAPVTIDGSPASEAQTLVTGSRIEAGGAPFLILIR